MVERVSPEWMIAALEAHSKQFDGMAKLLRETFEQIPYMVTSPEIVWEGIESAPRDGKQIWVSDGVAVWMIVAREDGDYRNATRCKYWTRYLMPAPPMVSLHPPGPRAVAVQ